jgi:hypothetical protein
VRREAPVVRAALAAAVVWGCDTVETAALAGLPADPLGERVDAARARLRHAHRTALAAGGRSPADWRMERDLGDALDELTSTGTDPPDPAGLVGEHTRGLRRRAFLTGGAATLATLAASAWWLIDGRGAPSTGPAPAVARGATPTPGVLDEASWWYSSRWPARGPLGTDVDIAARVVDELGSDSRFLYAADVSGVRVVVAALLGRPNAIGGSTVLAAWGGPAGAPAARLTRVPLALDRIDGSTAVAAVAVPRVVVGGDGARSSAVLVLLSRPRTAVATWSPVVHPTANGSVERTWTVIRLDDGVATQVLDRLPGNAARVQCEGYDGSVPTLSTGIDPAPPITRAAETATALVASATGVPAHQLRSEVVVDSPVGGSVLDAYALSATGGDGRLLLIHTTTPDGALVRTLHVSDDGRSGRPALFGPSVVIRARDAASPLVRRLDRIAARTTRFLVVAPGAARCRLVSSTAAGPRSEVVAMKHDTALVTVHDATATQPSRLEAWNAAGRLVHAGEPATERRLLDMGLGA